MKDKSKSQHSRMKKKISPKAAAKAVARKRRPELTDEEIRVLRSHFDAESWNAGEVEIAVQGAEVAHA